MIINTDMIHPLSAFEWENAKPYRTNEVHASGRIFFKQCKLGTGDTGYVGGVASERNHEAYAMCQEAEKAALAFLSGDSDHGILKAPRYAKFAKLESYYKRGNDIGRIDYLHTDGRVRESIEYTSPYQLEKDIKEENHYGVPMSVVLYKQADGSVIPHDYIAECDPPLNGFSVIDNPYLKSSLDIAKEIIDEYCREEFERDEGQTMYGFRVILQERYIMFLTLNVHKYELSIFIHEKAAWEKWVVACKDGFWVKDRHGKQLFRIRNNDELAVAADGKVTNLPGNCYYWDEDHICVNHKVYTWAELEDYAARAAVSYFGWCCKPHKLIPMRRNLPDGIYYLVNGKIAYIRKGGTYEYIPWSHHHCFTLNGRWDYVRKHNAKHATPDQIEAMSVGCWKGWDDPKADPAYCGC